MDRRSLRAEARRAAYEDATNALAREKGVPRETWKTDLGAVSLYLETRNALVAWLGRRALGVLGPPPGGVGCGPKHARR